VAVASGTPAGARGRMAAMDKLAPIRSYDRFQRRHRALALPLAILKKVSEDGAGNYSALVAYYGFLALFPLLLLAISILGFVLQGDHAEYLRIKHSELANIPIFDTSFKLGHLHGSGLGVVVGALGTLLAGLGVTMSLQTTFNQVNGVPHKRRPNFFTSRLRGLRLLATVGTLQVLTTGLTGLLTAGFGGAALIIGGLAVSFAANVLLFFVSFRLLTDSVVPRRSLWPGIIFASVGWEALQALGGIYVQHVLRGASATYGTFATVIGLLAWLYLGARVVVYGAELNVILANGYWPRSLIDPPTPADDAVRTVLAHVEERAERETIDVTFEPPADAKAP
jgi:YihY family inner membrane protein